jgi:hypothetical protein
MTFTLEALNAKHGDALLLHYGKANDPKLILIDGGPRGVFNAALKPRLAELSESRGNGAALPIRLLMVSHIDDDHIAGVLDLTHELVRADEDGEAAPYEIASFWHNSFDDLVQEVEVADLHTLATKAKGKNALDADTLAVPSSVGQGRDLRNAANLLDLRNRQFKGLVRGPAKGKKRVALGDGLTFTVIGPRQAQLDALQTDWAQKIAKLRRDGKLKPAAMEAVAAAFVDESVYNLSSIVVLAEHGKRRMLLTGDARGDYILEGARAAGLLGKKPLHVDLFKLPHHGSVRNAAAELFASITADHYVISADGKHGNPDTETLELLVESREPDDEYVIHLTNKVPSAAKFLQKAKKGRKFEVVYRKKDELSVVVELGG